MPIDYTHYPPDWHAFSRWIRLHRARNRCESCGVANHTPAPWRPTTRIVLTVAHLCACDPPCDRPSHVKALCQREHLALDRELHARHAAETRRKRREAAGQLSLLDDLAQWSQEHAARAVLEVFDRSEGIPDDRQT